MFEHYLGLIELLLSGAIALGFVAYQYWATSRSIEKDKASAREARHAEGEHPLDDR